ncbi:MAG: hypothetical protein V1897_05585 [Pseudomonadota bacterium]
MKRSDEILRVIRINDQAIGISLRHIGESLEHIKESRRIIDALSIELREIANGDKLDHEIKL